MKTVAIVYGWAEGPWQSKRLRQMLNPDRFSVTKDVRRADLILAHSAGCYFLPADIKAKRIILIGLAYWPGKSMLVSLAQKLWWEIKHHHKNKDLKWWFAKMSHNIYYIFSKPQRTYMYLINRFSLNLPASTNNKQVILVRNQADTLSHPKIQKLLPIAATYEFIEMPGGHDDCWTHPKSYIEMLTKEL